MSETPDISVVIPLLNESESLPELAAWIDRVMTANRFRYEAIFIDDGSSDRKAAIRLEIPDADGKILAQAEASVVQTTDNATVVFKDEETTVSVPGDQHNRSALLTANFDVDPAHFSFDIAYDPAGTQWITDVTFSESAVSFVVAENTGDQPRSASLKITYKDTDVECSSTLRLTQEVKQLSIADLRAMIPGAEGEVELTGEKMLSAVVISDAGNYNMETNPNLTDTSIDFSVNEKTAYIESLDGQYGLRIVTKLPADNILKRYSSVQLSINGLKLVKESNPERYTLTGFTKEHVLNQNAGTAADLPKKEKHISELTDADIYTYVTENTFDSYLYQLVEGKQKFIGQIMTSKSPVRSAEDIDETALSYAEIKALCSGNPHIKEKMDLDVQVSKLKLLKANHTSQIYRLESDIAKRYPVQITALKEKIAGMRVDADVVKGIDLQDNDHFAMTVGGKLYTDKKEAGVALISAASGLKSVKSAGQIGEYHGFALSSEYNFLSNTYTMTIKGKCSYKIEFGKDTLGNIQRIHNALFAIEKKLADTEQNLETVQQQLKTAQEEVQKPFPKEAELSEKMERLTELNAMLNMDEKGGENLLADEGIGENPEVNVTEERQDRIADSVHKTSILERLKEQKQQEQTGETQQKPKKKHEQEL